MLYSYLLQLHKHGLNSGNIRSANDIMKIFASDDPKGDPIATSSFTCFVKRQ